MGAARPFLQAGKCSHKDSNGRRRFRGARPGGSAVEDDGDGAVVLDPDEHARAEASCLHAYALGAERGAEGLVDRLRLDVSGSKPWRERALGEAVDPCERGDASGIIVAWQDRLSRENGRATAEVWEALENG
jgi:hypothetical protein